MAYIRTILPKNIESHITICDDFILTAVTYLLEELVQTQDDHYILNPRLKGNPATVSSPKQLVISHQYVAELLIKRFPLELMMWYQCDAKKSVNVALIHYLVKKLHEEPYFIAARFEHKLPQSTELLEELIEWDTTDVFLGDQDSHAMTEEIISNMISNNS